MVITRETAADQVALLLQELHFWLSARRSPEPVRYFIAGDQVLLACTDRKLHLQPHSDRLLLEFLGEHDERRSIALSITAEAFERWPLLEADAMGARDLVRAMQQITRALSPYAPPNSFMIGNLPEELAPGEQAQVLVGCDLAEDVFTLAQIQDLLVGEANAMNLDHDVDLVITPPGFACPADVIIDHGERVGLAEVLAEDDAGEIGRRLSPVAMMTLSFDSDHISGYAVMDGIAHLDFFTWSISIPGETPLDRRQSAADAARAAREELGIDHMLCFIEEDLPREERERPR